MIPPFAFSMTWRTNNVNTQSHVVPDRPRHGPHQVRGLFAAVHALSGWDLGELHGDAGALIADSGGTTTVSRQCLGNSATGLVNDVPGEADLTPELWGTLVLR